MDFSAISKKTALGKLVRFPLRLIPRNMVVPVLQGPLRGARWIVGSGNHGCWLGSYELNKQLLFCRAVKSGQVVYDIGAHVGFYTLLASRLVGLSGQVVAFEPSLRNLRYLENHLQINKCTNVVVFPTAVSDFEGESVFGEGGTDGYEGHLDPNGQARVDVLSLDYLVGSRQAPIPDCIKMDIEGSEIEALRGATRVLTEYHPVILLATHGDRVHELCCTFLATIGYSLSAIGNKSVTESRELLAQWIPR